MECMGGPVRRQARRKIVNEDAGPRGIISSGQCLGLGICCQNGAQAQTGEERPQGREVAPPHLPVCLTKRLCSNGRSTIHRSSVNWSVIGYEQQKVRLRLALALALGATMGAELHICAE